MSRFRMFPLLLVAILAMGVTVGCQQTRQAKKPAPQPEKPMAEPAPEVPATPASTARSTAWMTSRAYPTGDPTTSAVLVERSAPQEVQAGSSYDYKIKVTNLTSYVLEDVTVTEVLADGYTYESADPKPTKAGAAPEWVLGNLRPRESRTITVRGQAKATGSIKNCNEISWASRLCTTTEVTKPALAMTLSGPAEAISCDVLVYKCVLTNNGTGVARGVVMEHRLPEGMRTEDGQTVMRANVGDLPSGQSREFTMRVKADRDGNFSQKCAAKADGNLTAESNAVATVITTPALSIDKTGPDREFAKRPLTYKITVKNTTKTVAKDTVVEDVIPAGAKFVSADNGGRLMGNKVVWSLGNMAGDASKTLTLVLTTDVPVSFTNTATAKAYCVKPVSDSHQTVVTGIPAILLEVIDIQDPILVGEFVTYQITVTNQGSAPGTGIKIACTLEDTMEFVSGTGDTKLVTGGKNVEFSPIASLAPGATATFRVKVKAVGEGDVRFKVVMNSDQLTRPVEETEATNFYK